MAIGQPAAVALSVHPRTTRVVLQRGCTGNVLVGYVAAVVRRPTELASLAVRFGGDQRLDVRHGEGPSSTALSVRNRCADVTHTLVDCGGAASGATPSAAAVSAAIAIRTARVRRPAPRDCGGASSPPAGDAYAETGDDHSALALSLFSSSMPVELQPGEYRFPFELPLPSDLPPSVASALGRVAYQVRATMHRPSRLFGATVSSPPVPISVYQAPQLAGGVPRGPALLGFPSLSALMSTPLLFETVVGGGRWKVSVYSPSSRVLFLGSALKLRMYATRADAHVESGSPDPMARLVLVEFDVALYEYTTHAVPGSAAAPKVTRRRVAQSSLCPWRAPADMKQPAPGSPRPSHDSADGCSILEQADELCALDPQTIGALGEAFDELPSVASLSLPLPADGEQPVQASSASPVFSVAHRLAVTVRACEGRVNDGLQTCALPERISFAAKVLVLPDALASTDLGGIATLPCYGSIGGDVVLAASAPASPPAYSPGPVE
ncbi:hypothetical protein IWQ57_004138 [Coemansia nantahalensis]|uniref:Uncharacterized protein n=1 Tax=Coemansia nantahalensis TaxID=2789366 RepID=A0ACC1JTX3_9FUNG|nr:hypothetical protein IWQ57_004138 [Coemansia nantahalensis]